MGSTSVSDGPVVPAHVPPELVRDVDIFAVQALDPDLYRGWKRIQDENPPVFFTPRNGGHWLATRAEAIERLFSDHETFGSHGISVPPMPLGVPRQLPIQADGTEHRQLRSLIVPHLIGKTLRVALDNARKLAIELIEGFRPEGRCDFVIDFAQHLPIQVFLDLVELPASDRTYLISLAEIVRTPDEATRIESFGKLMAYLGEWIDQRRAYPGDDMISRIVTGKIDGRPLTTDEMLGECSTVLLGGLDTVASMMGFIAAHLAANPALRHRLASEPALIEKNIDEIMRRFGVAGPARRAARDVVLDGATIRRGDSIFIASVLHGLDEHRWADPLTVDLGRNAASSYTFGSGPHRCPGAALARNEIIIFLEEWLKRIPDYEVDPAQGIRAMSGNVNGVLSLPLRWAV